MLLIICIALVLQYLLTIFLCIKAINESNKSLNLDKIDFLICFIPYINLITLISIRSYWSILTDKINGTD